MQKVALELAKPFDGLAPLLLDSLNTLSSKSLELIPSHEVIGESCLVVCRSNVVHVWHTKTHLLEIDSMFRSTLSNLLAKCQCSRQQLSDFSHFIDQTSAKCLC